MFHWNLLFRGACCSLLVGLTACDAAIDGKQQPGSNSPTMVGEPGVNPSGGSGGGSGPMPAAQCLTNRRLRSLSPDQIDSTVVALQIAAPSVAQRLRDTISLSDATFSSLAARLDMSQPHVAEIYEAAKQIANGAVAAGGPAQACLSAQAGGDCVRSFLSDFGKRAFRRPLLPDELASFATFYEAQRKQDDVTTSMTSLLRALFMSPSFLFRSELGPVDAPAGPTKMTDFEIASSMAYYLTDAPPDAELFAAAERGELGSAEGRAPHARRLIAQSTLASGLQRFFGEYFRTAAVGSVSARDTILYPDFNSDVARAYGQETQAFFSEVMVHDDARLSTLLTAPYVMATARTAPFYGIAGVTSDTPTRQVAPAGQRAGILTQAAWLTRFAHDKEGNPVSRGRFVRERLLCDSVPPPPPTVNAALPPPDATRTQRERLTAHKADPTCAGCHVLMDPIGFAFSNYDAVGRYQALELGKPIDASGTVQDSAGQSYAFTNGVELAQGLATSPVVQRCFSKQVFYYAQGLSNGDEGACAFPPLGERMLAAGESTVDRIVAMVSADEFFTRIQEAP